MPTYEYRCENGHEFEAFQKMSDDALDACPECGAPAVRKISSGAGLVFKGSGFYHTDYKRADEKKSREDRKKKKRKSSEEKGGSGDSSPRPSGEGGGSTTGSGGTKTAD